MDELLTQFLIESRELVQQVVDDLLALERAPGDAHRFDDAFRGFHTLKGGAGIVEFAAMQTALHCAEDALAAVRAESRLLSTLEIGNCLRCLDQVAEWLDEVEESGAIPADADPAEIVALFDEGRAGDDTPPAAEREWVAALSRAHVAAAADAETALRYRPAADAFFRGEDPLARIAALPGLLALDLAPREPWPKLDELDPYSCNLTITALLARPPAEAAAALGAEARRCDIEAVATSRAASRDESLAEKAREILEAQLELLAKSEEPEHAGHVASAGVVAVNVLRHVGRGAEADTVETAAAVAIAEGRLQPLVEAISAALDGAPARAADSAARRHDTGLSLRVSAERIDTLVRLTGELIVGKNAIGHAVKLAAEEGASFAVALKNQHDALSRVVDDLQRAVVAMRVLPLRVAFQRFPRLIREMSAELERPAALVVEGENTEADKAIVEALVEPLVHVMRNALDHGIEDAATRAAAGKPAVATIRLRAAREGDNVVVEVADDGAGIDLERVKQVAQTRNLLTEEELAGFGEEEALELIFRPGFSTAAAVTELSGRGVGMDAVRTAVARIGGQVEARTAAGRGTTVRLTLPFSVLVTEVMTVEAGGQRFGMPLDSVVETIRVRSEDVHRVGSARAIVLRDRTVPLIRLADLLAREAPRGADAAGPVVIVELAGELGAVQVDKIGERMEVILKPFDGLLAGMPGLAGSTLLGDGSVLLVLDLVELLQ